MNYSLSYSGLSRTEAIYFIRRPQARSDLLPCVTGKGSPIFATAERTLAGERSSTACTYLTTRSCLTSSTPLTTSTARRTSNSQGLAAETSTLTRLTSLGRRRRLSSTGCRASTVSTKRPDCLPKPVLPACGAGRISSRRH